MRIIGQLIRLIDDSLKLNPRDGLMVERSLLMEELHGIDHELEREKYKVIPIQKLVRVQVGAALEAIEYLRSRPPS